MELTISNGENTRVTVAGEIDERGAEQLKSALSGLSTSGLNTLCLDLAKVTHIGSAGLGKFLLCYKRFSASGVSIRVENASPEIRELLTELRLDTLFVLA